MGKTRTTAITTSDWTAITASIYTQKVTIGEDASVTGWPTTDISLAKPTAADQPMRLPSGVQYTFELEGNRHFGPGDILGYVKAVSAGTTIFIDERGA